MKNRLVVLIILIAASVLAAQNQLTAIPAGTPISIRTIDPIDSKTADVNRKYAASLADPLMVGAVQLAPRNADVQLRVVENKQAGAVSGRASLVLQVAAVSINGQMVFVDTGTTVKESGSQGAKTTKRAIFGGLAGAGIGAIAGGGKGAAIGAGAGSTVGVVSAAMSGERVKVPAETRLIFTLSQDAPLPGASAPGAYVQPSGNPLASAPPVSAAPNAPIGQRQQAVQGQQGAYIAPRAAPGSTDTTVPAGADDRPTQSFEDWTVVLDHCEKAVGSVTCFLSITNTAGPRDVSLRVESAITAVDSSFNVLIVKAVQLGTASFTEGATGMTMPTGVPANGSIRFTGIGGDATSLGKVSVMLRWPNGSGVAEFRNIPLMDAQQ